MTKSLRGRNTGNWGKERTIEEISLQACVAIDGLLAEWGVL